MNYGENQNMRRLMIASAAAALAACGLGGQSAPGKGQMTQVTAAFEGPVPQANCGPGSHAENGGIQGRVSQEDRQAGAVYSCNLEEVGHEGDGSEWQLAWYDDCAYYGLGAFFASGGTAGFVPGAPNVPAGGVAVVDVKDPTKPVRTETLMTPGMIDPWESLKVNQKRGLLAGSALSIEGVPFDVYDVKKGVVSGDGVVPSLTDCAHPVLLSSTTNVGTGHEGEWAPDGMTYYSSGFFAVPTTTAIDVSIPEAPHVVATIKDAIHGLSVSDDGNRIYAADNSRQDIDSAATNQLGTTHATPEGEASNGLEIWDTSAIQSRASGPTTTAVPPNVLGSVWWDDGGTAQMTIPVVIKGRPYVIFIDEGQMGMARIIDISDEKNPFIVSKLKLEFDLPDYEDLRAVDSEGSFAYNGHYCGVPQRVEPGVVACSYFNSGVRVFDIRDPAHPKEIAYYIPKHSYASSSIRFVPERAEMWFTSQKTGLHIVRFTNGVWPFKD